MTESLGTSSFDGLTQTMSNGRFILLLMTTATKHYRHQLYHRIHKKEKNARLVYNVLILLFSAAAADDDNENASYQQRHHYNHQQQRQHKTSSSL